MAAEGAPMVLASLSGRGAVLLISLAVFVSQTRVWPLFQAVRHSGVAGEQFLSVNCKAVFLRPRSLVAVSDLPWLSLIATAISMVAGALGTFQQRHAEVPGKTALALTPALPFAFLRRFSAKGWVLLAGPVDLFAHALRGALSHCKVP